MLVLTGRRRYFEWLKNLSHVRFGRLARRWEERGKLAIVTQVRPRGSAWGRGGG